ncbi:MULTISPECIES: LysR family transcriptional regulator [unclassified Pseudoalteromonas]|jgi:DNA-binding transcriptional LysR family regulator|uniref:LysR family transcriptional regulator n=1 Tax=unclassified Pseudoalteromonas TaxID=194690 RepID=UPI00072FF496|nr:MULTISPECIES: LysR family transcriptional regulator [unclassified Pseudoalteromonas]KTD98136.1 LysR family transcriptional regulator [Pseudoalteromonas sp. H71]MBW4965777.1 LysR family transcriptional regulator [Pseudoalteromonas sp. CR1]TMN83216.1 LysR family transcriptional regulator [Pseudoalteromonas sp. S410]TMN89938.1 LysR family transcriptional regulator [Pseudoalteromonas sp. S408]TMN96959.1 LysR family transcriptional regulator [Pseudoalteromonas sp. S409]|tara:strand:+ start:65 stop:1003 length:939 start_codon:yes stop_codon:yes gene_type:complete
MDTTSRLLMLLEVVEQGSFAKAAELRNIDRSVISKQISRLEDELGVRLLNRTTRSFSLTAAGAEMIKKAGELRELLGETVRMAENYHLEPRGVLKITSSTLIGRRYLQPVLNDFQKRFPQVEVELRLDDRLVDIVSEGFDLAFRIGEPKDSSLIARKIARNRLLIVAAPEFISTYGMPATMEELADLPAASYASNSMRVETVDYYNSSGEPCEQKIKSVYRANDAEALLMKAISGTAYFVAPAFIIGDEITDGKLIPILTDVKLMDYSAMYAVYPHRDLPVRTRLFFDAVREYLGKDKPIWEHGIPNFEQMY